MNNDQAKILLVLKYLEKAKSLEIALSGLLTKRELEDSLVVLENEGWIIRNLNDEAYELTPIGTNEFEEYSKNYQIYRLEVTQLFVQRPEDLKTEAHGSVICFKLYDYNGNEVNNSKMCLRSVMLGEALGRVRFKEGINRINIFHRTALKNFERFILGQIPDFQIIYSSNNYLGDFEVEFEGVITNNLTIFLFGKLEPETAQVFLKEKSDEFDKNEREGKSDKNRIGILRDAGCIPSVIF